ncbi:hypothetical protein RA28_04990 [Ruegeria sp. ANG-S4]|uniref:hypothetical protein n=1 Tax=Ruegeria sp. ANG-S4 TaxID=1577904 RepID=UPI00057CA0FF|nr:hypothetical protein [Ruegeria sp. ANG-S4]KIC47061.1 hypothetical protein RA28_04990 [Ruegeria sp. ANG-S4]
MRLALLGFCFLLAGCETVRSTSDRLFGGAEPQTDAQPQATEVETAPEPVAASSAVGWNGPRKTVAGLGDPTTPGRWLETSLVEVEMTGRVVVPRTGAQAYITLVPGPGAEGSGSRLSLDAMRALLVPFDELVELEVYSN